MNQQNRDKVLDFISQHDCTPLVFHGYSSHVENPNTDYSVQDMVKRVLDLSKEYPSYNSEGEYETPSGKWRSSLDIWRHIIYYYPDVQIFDVLRALYEIYHVKTSGQFCSDILRRTFRSLKPGAIAENVNYMTPEYMYNHTYGSHSTDEYGLEWDDWKDI